MHMAERDDINKLYDKMKAIGINVGGCAVLYDKDKAQYYLVEHPVERLYLVNHDFFYNFARLDFAKKCEEMELLFKYNI